MTRLVPRFLLKHKAFIDISKWTIHQDKSTWIVHKGGRVDGAPYWTISCSISGEMGQTEENILQVGSTHRRHQFVPLAFCKQSGSELCGMLYVCRRKQKKTPLKAKQTNQNNAKQCKQCKENKIEGIGKCCPNKSVLQGVASSYYLFHLHILDGKVRMRCCDAKKAKKLL